MPALKRTPPDAPFMSAAPSAPPAKSFMPVGTMPHEEGVSAFEEQAMALKEGGVDVLWIETMSSEEELRAAVEGAAKAGLPLVTHHEL